MGPGAEGRRGAVGPSVRERGAAAVRRDNEVVGPALKQRVAEDERLAKAERQCLPHKDGCLGGQKVLQMPQQGGEGEPCLNTHRSWRSVCLPRREEEGNQYKRQGSSKQRGGGKEKEGTVLHIEGGGVR
jgi:hypothetical protein